jgi:hypothetical protein
LIAAGVSWSSIAEHDTSHHYGRGEYSLSQASVSQ